MIQEIVNKYSDNDIIFYDLTENNNYNISNDKIMAFKVKKKFDFNNFTKGINFKFIDIYTNHKNDFYYFVIKKQ